MQNQQKQWNTYLIQLLSFYNNVAIPPNMTPLRTQGPYSPFAVNFPSFQTTLTLDNFPLPYGVGGGLIENQPNSLVKPGSITGTMGTMLRSGLGKNMVLTLDSTGNSPEIGNVSSGVVWSILFQPGELSILG